MESIIAKCRCGARIFVDGCYQGSLVLCPLCGQRASIPPPRALWAFRIAADQKRDDAVFFSIRSLTPPLIAGQPHPV